MPQTLKSTVVPLGTKGIIRLAMHSQGGSRIVWCVVEGSDDVGIYNKFLDRHTTRVLQAVGEHDGKGGYENVVGIVTELHGEDPRCLIFGICDRDYMKYHACFTFPSMVFLTDNRDIEIMMLSSSSVIGGLARWDILFPQKLKESVEACRYFGYLRIYNHVFEANCTFHGNIKYSKVWDFGTHSLRDDWQDTMLKEFVRRCANDVEEETVSQFIESRHLEKEPWTDVCRGHDVLDLLHLMMVKKEYTEKAIFARMVCDYSYDDFKASSLCKNIESWANAHKLKVLK